MKCARPQADHRQANDALLGFVEANDQTFADADADGRARNADSEIEDISFFVVVPMSGRRLKMIQEVIACLI